MAGYSRGRNVLLTGGLVLASVGLFVTLFGVMTGRSLKQKRSDLFITLPAASGLVKGDAVLLRGVAVGEVRALDFGDDGAVIINVRLNRPVPLTQDAWAVLTPVDMFGRQSLVLQAGHESDEPVLDGDTIGGSSPPGLTARLDRLTDQAQLLLGDTTVLRIHDLLGNSRDAAAGIDGAARELDGVLRDIDRILADEAERLDGVLHQVERLGANLAAASDSTELMRIRENLIRTTGDLSRMVGRIDSTSAGLQQLIDNLNRGQGSLGLLLTDPALYENASSALARLDALLADIRSNPRRYVSIRIF